MPVICVSYQILDASDNLGQADEASSLLWKLPKASLLQQIIGWTAYTTSPRPGRKDKEETYSFAKRNTAAHDLPKRTLLRC